MLHRITEAQARDGYRVWIRFEDGLAGEVSLEHLAGRGVFAAWNDEEVFRSLFLDEESGTIAWPGGIDVAPDTLYRRLTESGSEGTHSEGGR